jgi:hypothetical protein
LAVNGVGPASPWPRFDRIEAPSAKQKETSAIRVTATRWNARGPAPSGGSSRAASAENMVDFR